MDKLIIFVVALAVSVGASFLTAQIAVFGLAQFHVNSGLLGTWLLCAAAEGLIASAVTAGIGNSKRRV